MRGDRISILLTRLFKPLLAKRLLEEFHMLKNMFLVGVATVCFAYPVWAQQNTITENINNTGIPRQAPSLGLGQIYGLNPCATGATAGVTTPLFGIGGAISTIDRECETRNNAAVVVTGLKDEAMAREILCTIKDVREAAARIGKPCMGDGRTVSEASYTVAQQMGTPEATSQIVAQTPSTIVPVNLAAPPAAQPSQAPVPPPQSTSVRPDAPAFCHAKDLAVYLYPECGAGLKTQGTPVSTGASLTQEQGVAKRSSQTTNFRANEHLQPKSRLVSHLPAATFKVGPAPVARVETMPLRSAPAPVNPSLPAEEAVDKAGFSPACDTLCRQAHVELHSAILRARIVAEMLRQAPAGDGVVHIATK